MNTKRSSPYDVVIVTQVENLKPPIQSEYHQNILLEEELLMAAFKKEGLSVICVGWDDKTFDWGSTNSALIRETWDYFYRIDEYRSWLSATNEITQLINPYSLLIWNLDKFYLQDLYREGINIPSTVFLERGGNVTLRKIISAKGWNEMIIKPAVAGAARDTYRINEANIDAMEETFRQLQLQERMLCQEFQSDILIGGEKTLVMLDGKYTHGILKKVKPGDFRVQDDHGGTVHHYDATPFEIDFATEVLDKIKPLPIYARVDIIKDINGKMALQELELIEPELWFRFNEAAADGMANAVVKFLRS